jgi:glycerol-3-phosphate cytidylyltransferase-like family protein
VEICSIFKGVVEGFKLNNISQNRIGKRVIIIINSNSTSSKENKMKVQGHGQAKILTPQERELCLIKVSYVKEIALSMNFVITQLVAYLKPDKHDMKMYFMESKFEILLYSGNLSLKVNRQPALFLHIPT